MPASRWRPGIPVGRAGDESSPGQVIEQRITRPALSTLHRGAPGCTSRPEQRPRGADESPCRRELPCRTGTSPSVVRPGPFLEMGALLLDGGELFGDAPAPYRGHCGGNGTLDIEHLAHVGEEGRIDGGQLLVTQLGQADPWASQNFTARPVTSWARKGSPVARANRPYRSPTRTCGGNSRQAFFVERQRADHPAGAGSRTWSWSMPSNNGSLSSCRSRS